MSAWEGASVSEGIGSVVALLKAYRLDEGCVFDGLALDLYRDRDSLMNALVAAISMLHQLLSGSPPELVDAWLQRHGLHAALFPDDESS